MNRSFPLFAFLVLLNAEAFTSNAVWKLGAGGKSRRTARGSPLRMVHVESVVTLLLAADTAPSLSELTLQASDAIGAASDIAGTTQASVGESLDSVGNLFGSIVDTVTSAKEQATDTALGSADAIKSQVGELGATALSPFQQLGESLTGGLDSLKSGAQGAVEGAQTQIGESVTEKIGTPFQGALSQLFSKFGTSPEELLKEEETWTNGVQQAIKGVEKVAPPSTLFYAENAAILPLWVAMIGWPEKRLTKTIMGSYGPLVLAALIYMYLTYECFQNPVSLQGFASGITNLPGLTKGFGEEVSVATAWSHFLAEDLFIGRWVYLDGQKNKVFTKHSLLLCYLFGPVGFLSHLFTRGLTSVVKPDIRDIMQAGIEQKPAKASREASPSPPPLESSSRGEELVANAVREAEEILTIARSTGAAQAESLLEEAKTEALAILKGAEVEKQALLKANKTTAAGSGAAASETTDASPKAEPAKAEPAEAQAAKAKPAKAEPAKVEPAVGSAVPQEGSSTSS